MMDEKNDLSQLKKKKKEFQLYEGLAWGTTIFLCLLAYFRYGLKIGFFLYVLAVIASVVAIQLNKVVAGIRESINMFNGFSDFLDSSLEEDDVTDL